MDGKTDRWLAWSLLLLAVGIVANSIAGPFISGIVTYPFSDSVRYMTIGLDAVSLIFVVPVSVLAAVYVYRGQRIGYIAALSPSAYALYSFVQLILGPQYIEYSPVVLLHLALFILSGFIFVNAWKRIQVKNTSPFQPSKKENNCSCFVFAIHIYLTQLHSRDTADI